MKTIVVMNLKGGVGKTITATNLAAILAARYGKRVLLVDADHQGNTSAFYAADQDGITLLDVLLADGEAFWEENVQRTGYEGVDILPANMDLAALDTGGEQAAAIFRLREFLLAAEEDNAYDYAIIDMPPAFSAASKAALVAADEVIIPMKLDAFSVSGMSELLRQIASMRRVNPGLRLAGVLVTMWTGSEMSRDAERILRGGSVPVFRTMIRRTDIADEWTYSHEPLYMYSPRCAASVDYRRFVAEYLEGSDSRG